MYTSICLLHIFTYLGHVPSSGIIHFDYLGKVCIFSILTSTCGETLEGHVHIWPLQLPLLNIHCEFLPDPFLSEMVTKC